MSAPDRRSEIAAILAAGIVRMKSRVAILEAEIDGDPAEMPAAQSVVSITNWSIATAPT
jgi:hypothetical protein